MRNEAESAVPKPADKEQGLMPKLRFPDFQDAGRWGHRALREFAVLIDERVGKRAYTPMSITSGIGLISQEEKFGRSIAGQQLKNYIVIRNGDFAYNKSATKEYPQGFAVMFEGDEPGCVPSSVFTCFSIADPAISKPYINYLLQANLHGRWLAKFLTIGARAHGSLNIDDDDLFALPVPLPEGTSSAAEQEKIAQFLSSLDALMVGENDRLVSLKNHKAGLMQQLFPAAGEAVPRLRFPEFQDAEEWAEKPLGEIATYENGKAYEPHIVEAGKYVVVNSRFISTDGAVRKWSNNPILIADKDDVLMVLSDLPNGKALAKCFRVDEDHKYAVNQRVCRLKPHSVRSDFLFFALNRHKFLLGFNDGMNQTHLSKDDVLTCPILHPKDAGEQHRIANCLSSIDALIVAKANTIEALRKYKKGLMQQLFALAEAA